MAAMLGYGLSNSGLSQSHQAHVSVSCSHFPFDFRGVVYFTPHSRRGFNPVSILHNSAVLESNFVCLCFSSSHLRPSWISISPIQFKTSYILQPLIRPKASDFTLRSSNVDNPDIGVSIKPKQSDYMDPSTSESALAQFETISPEDVKVCLRRKGMLKYYTLLAGQLASEGYMTQFTELLQVCARERTLNLLSTLWASAVPLEALKVLVEYLFWFDLIFKNGFFKFWKLQFSLCQQTCESNELAEHNLIAVEVSWSVIWDVSTKTWGVWTECWTFIQFNEIFFLVDAGWCGNR